MHKWAKSPEGRHFVASQDYQQLKERMAVVMARAPTRHEDEPSERSSDLHGTTFGPTGERSRAPQASPRGDEAATRGTTAEVWDIWQLDITGRVVQFCGTGGDQATAKAAVEGRWMDALAHPREGCSWVRCDSDFLSSGVGPYHLDGTEFYINPQHVPLFAVEPRKPGMHFRDYVGLRLGFEIPDPPEPPVEDPPPITRDAPKGTKAKSSA